MTDTPTLTPGQQAANLPPEVKARLDTLTEEEAAELDVTSDEHQYVWGFRQNRPDEERAERLADATAGKDALQPKLAAAGHDMAWELEDLGPGTCAKWYGTCRNCGAGTNVHPGGTGNGRNSFRCARDVECRGPGTAWQDEMQMELVHQRLTGAVGQYGQEVKDAYDRDWLASQGLEGE